MRMSMVSLILSCNVSYVYVAEWLSIHFCDSLIFKSMGNNEMDKTAKEKELKTPPPTSQV